MKKKLETIKEENYDKQRPQSAKNPQKYTDKYTKLDEKHKGIKKELKTYETGNKSNAHGGFNNFVKVNDKIGVRKPRKDNKDKTANKDFNAIFVSSLLEICGEKTIDSGKEQTNIYVDLAKNDLFDEIENMLKKHSISTLDNLQQMMDGDKLSEKEQTKLKYFLLTDLFSTDDFWKDPEPVLDSSVICNFLSKNLKEQKELSFASRWLCKIFLLQMFDRKAENVVVFEDKDGKIDFCDIDFDDNKMIERDNNSYFSIIFGKLVSQNDKKITHMNLKWRKRLRYLKGHYDTIVGKNNSIKTSFAEMIKNYTMTTEKIEELIKKTALKAKYMGLSEQDVIDGINTKIKLWKDMLNDQANGEIVNKIGGINEAREQTLKALKQITKEKVSGMVQTIKVMHDFTYEDKPDERKIKDDNDVVNKEHKKTNEDIASKAKEMISVEKPRISRMQKQASFIRRFVSDGMEIQTDDITANNLISYFKLEKDRSRSFFWVFGQRNKRFNALCEELEKQGIDKPENLFIGNKNYMEDEKQIRDLFDEQQQGNNVNQAVIHNINNLQNTRTIQQQIANRLNQVGCCSFG